MKQKLYLALLSVLALSTYAMAEEEEDTRTPVTVVSAIYILDRGGKVEIYYTESDGVQQKTWEQAITEGKM